MNWLRELDRTWMLRLNGMHHPWLDPIMWWISNPFIWIPLYAFILFLVIKNYKQQSWVVIPGGALAVALADKITSGFMKPYFARPRPSHAEDLQGLLHHLNDYLGGKYGFASGHAATTFSIAVFFFLILRGQYRWAALLFQWTILVSYSRIYLGVHYPGDILVGMFVGFLCALLCFLLSKFICRKYHIAGGRLSLIGGSFYSTKA